MNISTQIASSIKNSSWIRKMFEEGAKRIQEFGEDKVFDFSIGNPVFEPPEEVKKSLIRLLESDEKGLHRYMPNAGYVHTRQFIADNLTQETGQVFTASDVVMTVGAGGGLNVILKTLLNPGEEVIVFCPYFMEYNAYVSNQGGIIKPVRTTEDFRLDLMEIEKAINSKTKALLINSPNNPTGVIYTSYELSQLGDLLRQKEKQYQHPISLISDEPYKKIFYEAPVPSVFKYYEDTIVITSSSKDLALPGERIGYLAISPSHQDRDLIRQGTVVALRILGFVNAPALMQRMLPLVGDVSVDITPYKKNRDLLYNHLTGLGFSCVKPAGAFYLFPQSPLADDKEFVALAQQQNLLLVPGSAFGTAGYFRLAYCFDPNLIERSLPIFTRLAEKYL